VSRNNGIPESIISSWIRVDQIILDSIDTVDKIDGIKRKKTGTGNNLQFDKAV